MRRTALILFATLAMASTAPASVAAPAPTAATGEELGAPPHALGASSATGTPSQAALLATSEPAVPDPDNPEGGRATAALNVLEAQGYASFSDFEPRGNAYTALVTDNGEQFRVVINPDTGQISRQ